MILEKKGRGGKTAEAQPVFYGESSFNQIWRTAAKTNKWDNCCSKNWFRPSFLSYCLNISC